MNHMHMDPRFPDMVGTGTEDQASAPAACRCANDNLCYEEASELSDPLLGLIAHLEVAATRLW